MKKLSKDGKESYEEAMQNAYLIITNKLTFEDLIDYNGCYLPYNPKNDIDNSVYDDIIDYFCELEEYEKCEEIKKIKESRNL